jgi:hypothetical protein
MKKKLPVENTHITNNEKAHQSRSHVNVMFAVFLGMKGIIHPEFAPHGQIVNSAQYKEIL